MPRLSVVCRFLSFAAFSLPVLTATGCHAAGHVLFPDDPPGMSWAAELVPIRPAAQSPPKLPEPPVPATSRLTEPTGESPCL